MILIWVRFGLLLTGINHFCHNKEFLYVPRGFSNINEMNEAIIQRHNSLVKSDDDVYCLGDCMLNDNNAGLQFIQRLNGNIHIIFGNHDTINRKELYYNCSNVIEAETYADLIKVGKYRFYLSHYPTLTSNFDIDKPLKSRIISLCGHTHTKDKFADMDKGLIYHVELDAHSCYPVSAMDIIEDLKIKLGEK